MTNCIPANTGVHFPLILPLRVMCVLRGVDPFLIYLVLVPPFQPPCIACSLAWASPSLRFNPPVTQLAFPTEDSRLCSADSLSLALVGFASDAFSDGVGLSPRVAAGFLFAFGFSFAARAGLTSPSVPPAPADGFRVAPFYAGLLLTPGTSSSCHSPQLTDVSLSHQCFSPPLIL